MSSDYVLAVDSSTSVGWVTLARIKDDSRVEILTEQSIKAYSHAEALLPAVHSILETHSITPSALRFLVFGDGPGSFTGLRIGASVISGLAFGIAAKVLGVASHAGIACAYASSVLFSDHVTSGSAPLNIRVFSDGGDTLISSTFRIFNQVAGGYRCELVELMEMADHGRIVSSSDTILIGIEGLWKGRIPIPDIEEMVQPDTLPISSGLISALYATGDGEDIAGGQSQFQHRGFVTDSTESCAIRYGQPIKAMTLFQRRGW